MTPILEALAIAGIAMVPIGSLAVMWRAVAPRRPKFRAAQLIGEFEQVDHGLPITLPDDGVGLK